MKCIACEVLAVARGIMADTASDAEIVDYLMKRNVATIHELIVQFDLDLNVASRIWDLTPSAFGPGGRGYAWMVKEVGKIRRKFGKTAAEDSGNSLDGMSNEVAKRNVNKLLYQFTQGVFKDDSWEAVKNVWDAMTSGAIHWTMTGSQYRHDSQGRSSGKEWKFEIEFVNKKGKPTKLYGIVVASGTGSVENPLEKYDLTAYVS